jgi:hypothetical protein
MKTNLLFRTLGIILLLLFTESHFNQLFAQQQDVTNGNINMQAILFQGYGNISDEDAGGGSNPTFIGKIAEDTDNAATLLLNTAYSTSHLVLLNSNIACIANLPTSEDVWGDEYPYNSMGLITNSSTGKFDWSVMSWETDWSESTNNARCQLINCGEDYCTDDNPDWKWGYRNPKSYNSSEWRQDELTMGNNGSKFRMKYGWRYTNGRWDSPLDFGTLTPGTSKYNKNSNRGAPVGANANLGYSDDWNGGFFNDGRTVTYKFVVPHAMIVTLTTQFNTNFDTHLHLLNSSGTSVIAHDDNGSGIYSRIVKELVAGAYIVVVEGKSASDVGDFGLYLTYSDLLPNPGQITLDAESPFTLVTTRQECPGTNSNSPNIDWIPNLTFASSSLDFPITYNWQRSNNNGASWFSIGDTDETGSQSKTGKMENYSIVLFRRAATAGGNTAYSNVVTVTARPANVTSGGTIGASTTVPLPQEYQQFLISSSPGVAQPAPVYSWEKKVGQSSFQPITPTENTLNYVMPELIETAIYRRTTNSSCPGLEDDIYAYSNEVTVAVQDPSGVISGTVTSDKGAPVAGVTITARRVQAVPGGLANKEYSTVTASDGTYTLEGLYFGPEVTGAQATFVVSPSKGDHVFDFASLDKILTNNVKTQTANFKDLTVFSVEGKINQICTTCTDASVSNPDSMALKDVAFKVYKGVYNNANLFTYAEADSIIAGAFKTGADGKYSITLNEQGYYKVIPRYKNHFFVKADSIVDVGMGIGVETAIQHVNFSDTTTNVISGLVKADCDQYIGRAVLQFTQQIKSGNSYVAGNFIRRDTANVSSGYYITQLPASTYTVTVEDIIEIPENANAVPLYNQDEIVNQFFGNTTFFPADTMRKDLSVADSTFNLTFHEKPQIAVIEFDGPTCSPTLKLFPLLDQGIPTIIKLGVFQGDPEKPVFYQGNNVFGCPAESGTPLRVSSNVTSGSAIKDTTLIINDGFVNFNVIPGEPTTSGDYSKQFNLDFDDKYGRPGGNASKNDVTPVILGSKIYGNDFVTTSPELPFLILRDPPGSQSYSFREANTVTEIATSFSTKRTNAKDVWIDVKLGAKFEAGLGVSYESAFWGNIKGSFAVTSTNSSSTEAITSFSNSQYYSTSSAGIPGDQGDVYYGGAINFLQAAVIEIKFEDCGFTSSKNLIIAPDGFETEYAYTEYQITTDVMPDLETLRDQPSTSANDKRKWQNQINIWQDVLDYNTKLKAEAKHQYNRSFDSGNGEQRNTVSTAVSKIEYTEFEMETDSSLAAEIGMELGGSGLSEGGTISLRMARGNTTTNTTMRETITGFVLLDGPEVGDKFSLNVKSDPVMGTPVFDLIAGETSCPHEENTKKRDVPLLTVDDDDITVLSGQTHSAFLTLRNESESLEARNYFLKYDPGASTGAANVNIAGAGIGPFSANIASQGANQYETLISRFSPNQANAILVFKAYDACNSGGSSLDADQLFEVKIKAKFDEDISSVQLTFPEDDFSVNSNSPASLSYTMSGYDLNLLTDIQLEYAALNSGTWIVAKTIQKVNLAANNMTSDWLYNIPADGKYKLRLKVRNGAKSLYSDVKVGTWDRKGPLKYGSAQPTDFFYSLGDEISQSFNEDLNCEDFNSSNFTLTRMSNGTAIPATLGCYENKIIIIPNAPITGLGDSVAVSLINISDVHGNLANTNFSWEFRVGNPELNANAFLANVTSTPITLTAAEAQQAKDEGTSGKNSTSSVNTEMFEDANGKLTLNFTLAQPDTNDVTINFVLAGTALLGSDYTLSGQHTFIGNKGVIKIIKGQTSAKLYIDPIIDTKQEADENVLLSVVNGGDYNIGVNNVIELLIKNDDTDDNCQNNGQVFTLANNSGGTSITPDTYHKLMLESDGDVATPTTVIFKGEKSVLLKPGFSVDNGAIFTASIEDCPNVAASAFNVNQAPSVSESGKAKQSFNDVLAMAEALGTDGELILKFDNPIEQQLRVTLLDTYAAHIKNYNGVYKSGENEVIINTAELSAGVYYLSVKCDFITYVHRIVILE